MANRSKKIIVSTLCLAVLGMAGFLATSVYTAWRKYGVEGHIHADFYSVAQGLTQFQKDTGFPANDLTQLIPKYISEIPKSDYVDRIIYTKRSDDQDWELSLYSTALSPPRFYVARFSQKFTEAEEKRVLLRYHSIWTVLKE